MNQDTVVAGMTPPRLPLWSRVMGVLTAPRATFESVVAHPRAFGVLAVVIVATSVLAGWFASTDVGKRAIVDQQVAVIEGFGQPVTDEAYDSLERQSAYAVPITVGSIVAAVPIVTAAIALVAYGVFGAILGGPGTLRATFAVAAHAGVVAIVEQLFVTPINYLRESMADPANLGVFLPMFDEGSFIANLAGSIKFFRLWWLLTLSIGLAVLYRRKTSPIFWTLLGIYLAFGLVVAGVKAFLGDA